jgi:hypothetical protein
MLNQDWGNKPVPFQRGSPNPKPATPGKGRGRLQTAARRGFYGSKILTTGEVAQTAYARKVLLHGRKLQPEDYKHIRRVLRAIARPIGRSDRQGRPILWEMIKEDANA